MRAPLSQETGSRIKEFREYRIDALYKSGPSKAWSKIKNPKAPAATRAVDGTF
jgi:hypothetical protein